jgi:hypothetical protein
MFRNFFKRIFATNKNEDNALLPMPPDWNLTTDELASEIEKGKRGKMNPNEWAWAKEYERNLMRQSYRFPKYGDLYQAKFEQTLSYQIDLSGVPASFQGSLNIIAGEQFWVYAEPNEEEQFGAFLIPVHYKDIEKKIVPEPERKGKM